MNRELVQPTQSPWVLHDQEGAPKYGHITAGQSGNWILTCLPGKPGQPLSPSELANARRVVHCVNSYEPLVEALHAAVAGHRIPNAWLGQANAAILAAARLGAGDARPGPWVFREQGDANEYCLLTLDERGWVLALRQNGELMRSRQLANMWRIVKSVNMHGELLDVLRAAVDRHAEPQGWLTRARTVLAATQAIAASPTLESDAPSETNRASARYLAEAYLRQFAALAARRLEADGPTAVLSAEELPVRERFHAIGKVTHCRGLELRKHEAGRALLALLDVTQVHDPDTGFYRAVTVADALTVLGPWASESDRDRRAAVRGQGADGQPCIGVSRGELPSSYEILTLADFESYAALCEQHSPRLRGTDLFHTARAIVMAADPAAADHRADEPRESRRSRRSEAGG